MRQPSSAGFRLLRVDLDARVVDLDELDPETSKALAGGALLAAWLLLRETAPGIDPFDPDAPLIVVGSAVAGANGPGLARCSFVARSPLTGGLGEARVEGPFPVALAASGFTAIVVTGRAYAPVVLVVGDGSARVDAADDLWGVDTSDIVTLAEERYGRCHVAAIGPGGERGVRFASIVTDRSFVAARTGVGAVMGAKQLKAIVLRTDGPRTEIADRVSLAGLAADYRARASTNPLSRWQHDPPGFGTWTGAARTGTFAVENYRTARPPALGGLAATAIAAHLAWSDGGCPGCPTDCVKGFAPPAERRRAAAARDGGLHQEAVCALGPNLGLADASRVLALNDRARRLGLDPVSLGFTLSFALEARSDGIIAPSDLVGRGDRFADVRFGEADGIADLVEGVGRREGAAAWLADGVLRAARAVGPDATRIAMHVKGLELPVFEPRTSPGLALGYAISPTGPRYDFVEHDADFDDVAPAWPHVLETARSLDLHAPFPMTELTPDKVRAVARLAELWSAFDALEVCIFAAAPTRPLALDDVALIVRAVAGWDADPDQVLAWGRRRLDLLRLYDLREGGSIADDTLPDRFFAEPVDDGPFRGAVLDRVEFEAARASVFDAFGWDARGVPRNAAMGAALSGDAATDRAWPPG